MKHLDVQLFINVLWGSECIDSGYMLSATLMKKFKPNVEVNVVGSNHWFSMDSGAQSALMNDSKIQLVINALFTTTLHLAESWDRDCLRPCA